MQIEFSVTGKQYYINNLEHIRGQYRTYYVENIEPIRKKHQVLNLIMKRLLSYKNINILLKISIKHRKNIRSIY